MRILIFKESREKRTFNVSNIYCFKNLTFWDWSPPPLPSKMTPIPFLLTISFLPKIFDPPPSCNFWESIPPISKGGGRGAHYAPHPLFSPLLYLNLRNRFSGKKNQKTRIPVKIGKVTGLLFKYFQILYIFALILE